MTAAAEQAGAHRSPSAPLPRSREVPLPMSRRAEVTGPHAATAGKVREPAEQPPLKAILLYIGKVSAGWMCKPAMGDVFDRLTKKPLDINNGFPKGLPLEETYIVV